MKCVLCNEDIQPSAGRLQYAVGWDEGNNAEPLAEGRCCDVCNKDVIAARRRRQATMIVGKNHMGDT